MHKLGTAKLAQIEFMSFDSRITPYARASFSSSMSIVVSGDMNTVWFFMYFSHIFPVYGWQMPNSVDGSGS